MIVIDNPGGLRPSQGEKPLKSRHFQQPPRELTVGPPNKKILNSGHLRECTQIVHLHNRRRWQVRFTIQHISFSRYVLQTDDRRIHCHCWLHGITTIDSGHKHTLICSLIAGLPGDSYNPLRLLDHCSTAVPSVSRRQTPNRCSLSIKCASTADQVCDVL